ncbi:MAG: NAD(P)-dependent oxidoreductase [Chloroflexota bacterium]
MAKILMTEPDYAATAADLASDFPDMELVCASDEMPIAQLTTPDVVGVVAQTAHIDETLLGKLDGLQVILKVGRSYHNVDVDAVRTRNLTLACVPRKGPNCVAELALTFIMSLSKDLLMSHESVATGAYRYRGIKPEITAQWKMAFHWMRNQSVHEVGGKTLGIIGMGEIGCELARRTSVLGMRNIYYKRTPLSDELEQRFDAEYRDLDALMQESDYVCIATPHTPETERMIGAEQIGMMKESAFIVNIARGGIIDEDALIDALTERRIAGAGLDVFTYEPLHEDSPLCALDNVMMTPHIGGGSGTNRAIELGAALHEMQRILAGEKPLVDVSKPL